MRVISAEVGPPSYEDFEVLKETLLELGNDPITKVRSSADQMDLLLYSEKDLLEIDFLAAEKDVLIFQPYSVVLIGKIAIRPNATNRLLVRYKEIPRNPVTIGSGLVHDYIMETEGHDLVEFAQSIRASPIDFPQQPIQSLEILQSDSKLNQVYEGEKMLKDKLGNQLELTAGDCGVLFDRIHEYLL